jgi:tetratricopeptide (TPR) repeat protein
MLCLFAKQDLAQEQEALKSRARAARERGDLAEALVSFRRAVSQTPDDASLPELLDEFAEVQYRTGRFSDAEKSAARALVIRRRLLAPNHPSIATSMNNLGEVLFAQGKYQAAEDYYRRALELVQRETPPDLERQARLLTNIGKVLTARNRSREASEVLRRALDLWTTLGNAFEQAVTLGNLGLLMRQSGRYADAEQMNVRALNLLDPDHPNAIAARINLADVLRIQKRYGESERQFNLALPLLESRFGRDHPDVAAALTLYADLMRATHRTGEAKRVLAEARRIQQTHASSDGGAWVVNAAVRQSKAKPGSAR